MKHPELFPIKKDERKPLEYLNKRGDTFYVKASTTKTGKTTYLITKTLTEDCVSELPDSYEVADLPTTGQLVVRKKLATAYTNTEIQHVETELKKNKALSEYKIDVRGDILSIFVKEKPDLSGFDFELMGLLNKVGNFEEMMRIKILTESNYRSYIFQRYNFRSSVDDWMTIGTGKNLQELAQKFIKHLGHGSYFEIGYGF